MKDMNRVFLMGSAFELRLGQDGDGILFNGIVRYIHKVDTSVLWNKKDFYEFLKPVLEDGKRKVALRWCGDGKSLLLIVYGGGGTSPGDAGGEDCEKSLDIALMK